MEVSEIKFKYDERIHDKIIIEFGFEFNGRKYGYFHKELYQLPYTSHNGAYYDLRKIPIQEHEKTPHYRLGKSWKSYNTIKPLIKKVDYELILLKKNKHLPL